MKSLVTLMDPIQTVTEDCGTYTLTTFRASVAIMIDGITKIATVTGYQDDYPGWASYSSYDLFVTCKIGHGKKLHKAPVRVWYDSRTGDWKLATTDTIMNRQAVVLGWWQDKYEQPKFKSLHNSERL